jgi:hypothetical protein
VRHVGVAHGAVHGEVARVGNLLRVVAAVRDDGRRVRLRVDDLAVRVGCQLLEKRLFTSTVRPLYSDFAVLWNSMTRAKFPNGRSFPYRTIVYALPAASVYVVVPGEPRLTSVERWRCWPFA